MNIQPGKLKKRAKARDRRIDSRCETRGRRQVRILPRYHRGVSEHLHLSEPEDFGNGSRDPQNRPADRKDRTRDRPAPHPPRTALPLGAHPRQDRTVQARAARTRTGPGRPHGASDAAAGRAGPARIGGRPPGGPSERAQLTFPAEVRMQSTNDKIRNRIPLGCNPVHSGCDRSGGPALLHSGRAARILSGKSARQVYDDEVTAASAAKFSIFTESAGQQRSVRPHHRRPVPPEKTGAAAAPRPICSPPSSRKRATRTSTTGSFPPARRRMRTAMSC